MSCSKMESASASPILPQEILFEILSKLPAKSLVRFKCVSKFFCSLLGDHPFADLHRNWSLTLPSSRMRILISFPLLTEDPNTNWYYTINYSEENQGKLRANRLRYIDKDPNLFRKAYLSSSVNGLICFCRYSRRGDVISIHNLSTRHHFSLPSIFPPDPMRSKINDFGLLGFDSVSRRYKVLKSVLFPYGEHVSVKHWIFTLGVDKSWREIHSSPYYYPYTCFNNHFYFRTSIHINGIIYSLNSLNNENNGRRDNIVAFDVRAENFQVIPPLPPPAAMRVGLEAQSGFAEVEGQLAIVHLIRGYGMEIWILKESMVWENTYSILIPIPLEEIEDFNRRKLFFATNHVGEIAVLVMLRGSFSILFYNFRRKNWRKFDIHKLPPRGGPMSTAMHFFSDSIF